MSVPNTLAGLLFAITSAGLVGASGCGTDAKGIEECRDIEQARCEAASACRTDFDVASCKLFYRDHCLHGLRVDPPSERVVNACVSAIEQAARCAVAAGAEADLRSCPEALESSDGQPLTACAAIDSPERLSLCAFIDAIEPVPPNTDAGSDGADDGGSDASDDAAGGDAAAMP
jgi:hypothetical protein